ncbi:hypothetical protein IJ00_19385 [Calothrix sp. 336/3]|nr:hypothetical protein IJ00_19385 [Calothrix sp. 336/3]
MPQKRSRAKEKLNPFWALGNILLFIGFLTILLTSYLGIFSFFVSDNKTTPNANSSYSTSIPWIFDKSECEHTGRTWRGQKCWDSEHSPNF